MPTHVDVINEKGEPDEIHLMPGGRVELPRGFSVAPNHAMNKSLLIDNPRSQLSRK